MSSNYVKRALREHANASLPEELEPDYKRELNDLAERVRLVYDQTFRSGSNGKPIKWEIAETVLNNWIKERMLCREYGRYCELMRSQGKQPREKVEYFRKVGAANSLHDRFEYIESAGIKIGSKVKHIKNPDSKTFEVIGVTVDCKLIFKSNGKRISNQEPTVYGVV